MKKIAIKPPYLIFLGEVTEAPFAKTGAGLVQWRRDLCVGQMSVNGGSIDLGLPQMDVSEAFQAGVKSLIIGTAAIGGRIPQSWIPALCEAALSGIDIVAGVHMRLSDIPELKQAALTSGAALIDVREPPKNIPVGTGLPRMGKRLLTVGTDCALGKKYTALALERDMRAAGMDADFRASGQTGIMIAGEGIPIDAVVSDFVSGAAELLSPANVPEHWDIIEGQGSLYHPGFSSVSLGLLIGSQPDAFVVCTDPFRTHIEGWKNFELPSIQQVIDRTIELGRQVNQDIRCVGVSVNTSSMAADKREEYLYNLSREFGLPCVDPVAGHTLPIIKNL